MEYEGVDCVGSTDHVGGLLRMLSVMCCQNSMRDISLPLTQM